MPSLAGSLRALLTHLIDYAGLFPPAALLLPAMIEKYSRHLASADSWILNRVVLPVAKLSEIQLRRGWRVTLLVNDEPGQLPPQVETLEIKTARKLSLPTYCEAPLDQVSDAFAKFRTGGVTPDAIPGTETVADFVYRAAARRLPFKASAGLHHPFRSERPLTYAPDSPRGVMHGFVNVFTAAAFAWHGAERATVVAILNETDPRAFEFLDDELRWRGRRLSTAQVDSARRDFAHSFGSCSFEEPVADLRELGLLP
ncbi:MAG TPA: hypothetical protein VLY04_07035 [Bryobacteraceae bacterium]|nr:hypothetical protein [Bryobacteraceae bacterium]